MVDCLPYRKCIVAPFWTLLSTEKKLLHCQKKNWTGAFVRKVFKINQKCKKSLERQRVVGCNFEDSQLQLINVWCWAAVLPSCAPSDPDHKQGRPMGLASQSGTHLALQSWNSLSFFKLFSRKEVLWSSLHRFMLDLDSWSLL